MVGKGCERVKIRIIFPSLPTRPLIENFKKKKAKKLKKLTNTIMAYFPANPGWERQRKGEKKNLSFRSFPT